MSGDLGRTPDVAAETAEPHRRPVQVTRERSTLGFPQTTSHTVWERSADPTALGDARDQVLGDKLTEDVVRGVAQSAVHLDFQRNIGRTEDPG